MPLIYQKVHSFLSSKYFFGFVLLLFLFQAIWVAFSFRYSMIYDEYYHFGLIEYFSKQLSPWISNQPQVLDIYGALDRQPHLLYHYLLSFPFRITDMLTDSLAIQVIFLRLLNIALFASGLVIFWHLFKEMRVKPVFRNISLLFFVLLPVTPLVAATINYDNFIFPLTALMFLLALRCVAQPTLQWQYFSLLVITGMIGSLSKSAFPPIFAAIFIFVCISLLKKRGKKGKTEFAVSFRRSSTPTKLAIVGIFLVVGFLFVERFAINVFSYGALSPSCTSQMTQDRCLKNHIEARAKALQESKSGKPAQFPRYASEWNSTMIEGLLITGANTNGRVGTKVGSPLPVIYVVVFLGAIFSTLAITYSFDTLRRLPGFWMIMATVGVYTASLFYVNYQAYLAYYVPVAIQGRYLLPFLPVIMIFGLLGFHNILGSARYVKLFLLVVVTALYINGAGLVTHIIRSDESWNWDNTVVREINNSARNILQPFVKEWWYER